MTRQTTLPTSSATSNAPRSSIGRALLDRGIASLSIDLPLHGTRKGDMAALTPLRPFAIAGKWRLALTDATAALDYLAAHAGIDGSRLALAGYSLGAFLSVQLAVDDPRIDGVVLAAGGDLPDDLPFESLVRGVADPVKSIRRLNTPVLMINGRFVRTVTPAQAKRLHEAAPEPKTVRWYPGGRWPPQAELDAAAAWLGERLASPRRKAG
jgi:dienelactone hydrolase